MISRTAPKGYKHKRVFTPSFGTRVNVVEKNGRFVNEVERYDLSTVDDVRDELVVEDFALDAVIANGGTQQLKDCGRVAVSTFDNVDSIDNMCEQVANLNETDNMNVQTSKLENNE